MKVSKLIFKLFLLSLVFVSCSDDNDVIAEASGAYSEGIIISGEGLFGGSSGDVAYINNDLTTVETYIFKNVNGIESGGVIQSVGFNGEDAYIIGNDANVIYVVDRNTFKIKGTVFKDIQNPRYISFYNGKGYVTNWGDTSTGDDDYVAVIDLETNLVTSKIAVSNGPEQILEKGGELFVSHKGAYTFNNVVSVIDIDEKEVVKEITVDYNPDELILLENGDLVVLSEGGKSWHSVGVTPASIQFIDTDTKTIKRKIPFTDGNQPGLMSYDNGALYYSLNGAVYSVNTTATVPSENPIVSENIYGMSVKDGKIYMTTYDFVSLSELIVYDVTAEEEVYRAETIIGASKIYFVE